MPDNISTSARVYMCTLNIKYSEIIALEFGKVDPTGKYILVPRGHIGQEKIFSQSNPWLPIYFK